MNPIQAFSACMLKYATFKGRARRSEYWWFIACSVALQFIVDVSTRPIGEEVADLTTGLLSLALFLPTISVASRRLHDIGRRGWWQLLPILTGFAFLLSAVAFQSRPSTEAGDIALVLFMFLATLASIGLLIVWCSLPGKCETNAWGPPAKVPAAPIETATPASEPAAAPALSPEIEPKSKEPVATSEPSPKQEPQPSVLKWG